MPTADAGHADPLVTAGHRWRAVRLSRLFTLATVLLLILIGLLLWSVLAVEWRDFVAARQGLWMTEVAYKAMVAAQATSAERGPTNGLLGDADLPDPGIRPRVEAARHATDTAIASLSQALESRPDMLVSLEPLVKAKIILAKARQAADQIAANPHARRSPTAVMGVVGELFEAASTLLEVNARLSKAACLLFPGNEGRLLGARLALELREYAGRLGSEFTAALLRQKPLGPTEHRDVGMLRGRILELRDLIRLQDDGASATAQAIADMETSYFETGLSFIDGVERLSDNGQPYGLSAETFAERYVPTMGAIVAVGETLMQDAITNALNRHLTARNHLAAAGALGVVIAAIAAALLQLVRRKVVAPLLDARRAIVDIAEGRLEVVPPHPNNLTEIDRVLQAIDTLRSHELVRRQLEVERQKMIEELRHLSGTDFLTGLANRRSFSETARLLLAAARRYHHPLSLVIFDIDHFKAVNDAFGHDAGDKVLVEVSATARQTFRESDYLARHGGEEFAAVLSPCDAETAALVTERVRMALESLEIWINDQTCVRVTASFGCAIFDGSGDCSLNHLMYLADKALYSAKRQGRNRIVAVSHAGLAD